MQRPSHFSFCAALLLVAGCSDGASATVEGESVVIAQRGTGFTEERRELDRELGIDTVPPPLELDASDDGYSEYSGSSRAVRAATEGQSAAIDPAAVDPSTLTVGGVDATLAARLKADPSAYATKKIENLVTFRMLSLTGIDLDSLLDYLFSPETERAKAFKFPAEIKALDQKEAAIVGYMIPLEYKPKTEDIKIFMLVRDLMACCFGGAPRPDEWVYVEMDGDSASKLYPYLPIVVRGKLTVGRLEDEFGLSSGVYSMKAKSVEEFKAE
jgi:hypothetical protein